MPSMGRLIYSMNVSLDGYAADPDGGLDWGTVDEEIHTWWADRMREADAAVWGRRVYELMVAYWPTAESDPAATPAMLEFAAVTNPKPKVVFSTTLDTVTWNGRLVRGDVGEVLARLREEFPGDLVLGGPTLAAQFVQRGLVDEYRLVVHPAIVGGGLPFFPNLDRPAGLRLVETRTFATGAVYLGYAAR
jgi:dihydrofolate reductase